MAGDSLQQYKQKQPQVSYINSTVSANRNNNAYRTAYNRSHMPGFSASIFPNGSKLTWQGSSYDPILANNSVFPTSSSSSGTNALNTITNVFAVATGALGLAAAVGQTVNLFKSNKSDDGFTKKESKEIARNTENVEDTTEALDACIATAKNLDENSSQSKIRTAVDNLSMVESQATRQKQDAICNVTSAQRSLRLINDKKLEEENVRNGLLGNKSSLTEQIKEAENTDTSNMTEEQKSAHKAKISKLKQQLKEVENKIKDSDKKLEKFDKEIAVQNEIIKNNRETAKIMEAKATDAKNEITRLNSFVKP